jgi:hypothetical protein
MTWYNALRTRAERGMNSEQDLRAMMLTLPENLDLGKIGEREDRIRSEQVRSDVANRLRNACGYLGDADFEALVEKITAVQLRGERRTR